MKATHWQNLTDPVQAPRYRAISAAVRRMGASRVLDIGAGAGVLRRYLSPDVFYFGVEPDPCAAAEAEAEGMAVTSGDAWSAFRRGLVQQVRPDVVVFSECLYYMDDPMAVLGAYAAIAKPGSAIVVTIFMRPEAPSVRGWVARAIRARRPASNQHCAEMVDKWARSVRGESRMIPCASGEWAWKMWTLYP